MCTVLSASSGSRPAAAHQAFACKALAHAAGTFAFAILQGTVHAKQLQTFSSMFIAGKVP